MDMDDAAAASEVNPQDELHLGQDEIGHDNEKLYCFMESPLLIRILLGSITE